MMAVDFFSNSSSVKAGLVGVCGGGGVEAVSLFTVHKNTQKTNTYIKYQCNKADCPAVNPQASNLLFNNQGKVSWLWLGGISGGIIVLRAKAAHPRRLY